MLIKNKRAWIRIIEAFVAILLIAGVLLVVIDKTQVKEEDISSKVYDAELSILREIQLNETLREDILNASNPPIEWDNFPARVKNKIISRTPSYLNCEGKICAANYTCSIEKNLEKDIYAQSVIITTTLTLPEQDYRQLKLFCWVK